MKISRTQLKQIIKEELGCILDEREQAEREAGEPEVPEPAMEEGMSGDEMRREVEKSMGLEPGTIKSAEQLKQAEKERREKAAAMPKNKVPPKPRPKKPYGGGSKYRPYGRST